MGTQTDFFAMKVLIGSSEADTSPVNITKDLSSGDLVIGSKATVDNSTAVLADLANNEVPTAKNVKDALAPITTDISSLSDSVNTGAAAISSLQGDVTTLQGDVTSLQGDIVPNALSVTDTTPGFQRAKIAGAPGLVASWGVYVH